MAREQQDYDDIPGTFVFDAERSRQGYGINMFCMSLMKDENRKAFKANEAEYLKKFKLTPEQTDAVLKRDYNRLLELRQHLFHRQARRRRRALVPASCRGHDRRVATGLRQHDARRRTLGRGQSLADRQERAVQIPVGCGFQESRRQAES